MGAQDDGDWVKYDDHAARIEALTACNDALAEKMSRAAEALVLAEGYIEGFIEDGCPKCGGDCSSANPPTPYCPIIDASADLKKIRATLAAIKEGGE
jgi:hypothetical protein